MNHPRNKGLDWIDWVIISLFLFTLLVGLAKVVFRVTESDKMLSRYPGGWVAGQELEDK